jgi:putative flippase GtrA
VFAQILRDGAILRRIGSQMLRASKNILREVIVRLHGPFSALIDLQAFAYLFCGALGAAIDIVLYTAFYLTIEFFGINVLDIGSHILAFLAAFCINFPIGFLLSKYVVFENRSTIRSRAQFFRYLLLVAICFCLNYLLLKLFVDGWSIYPTVAKIMATIVVTIFSYLYQKYFAFIAHPANP